MAARPDENAVSPPQPQAPDVDNPFLLETETGGGVESPAPAAVPDPTATPPSYTEALTQRRPRTVNRAFDTPSLTASVENTPLLRRQLSNTSLTHYRESDAGHVRRQGGITRALLLWLGIGQWYSGLCIFISFVFFAGGGILVVLSVLTLDALYQVKITTIAAGVLFVLLSILWPCTWLWNQYNKTCGCSYAPLITYTWMLTLAYTTIMGALLFGVNEHYDCIHFCHNCTFTKNEQYRCEYVEVSLWTLVAMLALMALFLVVTCVYCFFHCLSCDKEPRRSYTLL